MKNNEKVNLSYLELSLSRKLPYLHDFYSFWIIKEIVVILFSHYFMQEMLPISLSKISKY